MASFQDLAKEITVGLALAYTPFGVAVDVKDTLEAAYNLHEDPKSDDNKLEMVICLIGWLQGPGDALKIGIRGVAKRPELLFDMVRFILQKLGQHADAEKWLDGMLKESKIKGAIGAARKQVVKYIRESDLIWDGVIPAIEAVFKMVEDNLGAFVALLARKVMHWKTKVPKTTQRYAVETKTPKVAHTPGQSKAGTDNPKNASTGKQSGTKVNAIIKTLEKMDIGLVGEHMADYWVAREIGFKAQHDAEVDKNHKISQGGELHKLHIGITGPGIDSVWKTDKKPLGKTPTRTYAIIEAKCSGLKPTSTPASLLGDLTKKPKAGTGKTAKGAKGGAQQRPTTPQPKDPANQQMSEEWVNGGGRLRNAGALHTKGNYSRHLIFFGIANPTVIEHFEAFKNNYDAPVASEHTKHVPSQTWNEQEIDDAIHKRIARSAKKK